MKELDEIQSNGPAAYHEQSEKHDWQLYVHPLQTALEVEDLAARVFVAKAARANPGHSDGWLAKRAFELAGAFVAERNRIRTGVDTSIRNRLEELDR